MFKETPVPIRTTFWKHVLLYGAIVAFGLIWSIVIHDADLLYLTAAIAALGAWRTIYLFKIIHYARYRILEGVVVSDIKRPLSSGHCLTLQLEDGNQINEIVAGSRLLSPALAYRIYLYSPVQLDMVSALPEALRPAQTLLGYERLQSDLHEHK